jgi:hypothetical protein
VPERPPMKSLLIASRGARGLPDTHVLVWDPLPAEVLQGLRSGVAPARTPEDIDAGDEAAMAWVKAFGRKGLEDGKSLRELLVHDGVPFWWPTEVYLHYHTAATGYVRLIETFFRILERERPDEVVAPGLGPIEAVLLGRVATALGVRYEGPARVPSLPFWAKTLGHSLESRLNSWKTVASSWKAALSPPSRRRQGDGLIVLLSHAAFWREGPDGRPYEHYFDRILPALEQLPGLAPFVVGVGPRAAFRRRGPWARLREWARLPGKGLPYTPINHYIRPRVARKALRATRWIRGEWRRLRDLPALREAFSHRGVFFSDLAGPDFAATLLLQVPWAVRSHLEMVEVLESTRARALVLYAESSGWGRVALEAARSRGVPSVALQHGILYPKYFSYRHDEDEGQCPRPTATALFGEAAKEFLVREGRYDPSTLVLTGSPKFDALLETAHGWDRAALRARHGVGDGETLVIVASRYRGILATHQSIGSAFVPFLQAVERRPGVRVLVKPHPAEGRQEYEAGIRDAGASRAAVVAPGTNLVELLYAGDLLVTVESLSAIEALVLERPILVLNMPTNLRELVESGAALGVPAGDDPGPALEALVSDPLTQSRLKEARRRYLSKVAMGVDGRATARILDLVKETAGGRGVVGF